MLRLVLEDRIVDPLKEDEVGANLVELKLIVSRVEVQRERG